MTDDLATVTGEAGRARDPRAPRSPDPAVSIAAELALFGLTAALAWSFARLFRTHGFEVRLIAIVAFAHLSAAIVRRRRWPVSVALISLSLLGVLVVCWVYLPSTLALGLPTGATLDALRRNLSETFSPFRTLITPVDVTIGFEITMAAGLWVVATFADAAAFTGDAPVQAIVPHAAAFISSSIFARGRQDVLAAAVVTLACLLYLVAHRAWRASSRNWVAGEEAAGSRAMLARGVGLVAVASAATLLVAPQLPGAGSAALVNLRAIGRGAGPVEIGNPLVGVGNLLGSQSNDEVFTVRSREPHYWRLTALEQFDSNDGQWKTQRTYRDVDSGQPLPGSSTAGSTESAHFELSGLPGIWLPTPYRPRRVVADIDLRYDTDTTSIIASGETAVPDTAYDVFSQTPQFDATTVAAADAIAPADQHAALDALDPVYTADPKASLPVVRTAQLVTRDDRTPRAKLLSLQTFFRDNFSYDSSVDYSGAADPTEAFLNRRTGFCQQFAATFAEMARILGIPSRVAVGFTYGTPQGPADPSGETTYVVRGRQAHAWPEAYVAGLGWVAFEPTPGRGNPDTTSLTGVGAAQDDSATPPGADATTTTTPGATAPTTAVTDNGKIDVTDRAKPGATRGTGTTAGPASTFERPWWIAGAAITLLLLGRIAWVRRRRRRRRGPADTPMARVRAAWVDSCDWLELLEVQQRDEETPAEFSRRASSTLQTARVGDIGNTLARLAELETSRIYGDESVSDRDAEAAESDVASVRTVVKGATSARTRVAHSIGWSRRN